MIDPRELNARGVRVRQAFDILKTTISTKTQPQQALVVAYAYAVFSNMMAVLEADAGVGPGYFGSAGAGLQEINPFSGNPMPAPISQEPTPPPFGRAPTTPLQPPTPTADQPPPVFGS